VTEKEMRMEKAKRLLIRGSILALLLSTLAGCYYEVRGPYPLVSFHRPGDYQYRDYNCRNYRDCNR
jgi:hypothetical protein